MFAPNAFNSKKLTLNEKELFFLAGMMGFNRVAGIRDPFPNDRMEEWIHGWKQVGVSLLQKGFISGDALEQLLAHPPFGQESPDVNVAYKRGCCLRYSHIPETGALAVNVHYYLNDDGIFEIRLADDMSTKYELTRLGTLQQSCDHVLRQLHLNSYGAADMPALTFPRQWFDEHVHLRDMFYLPQLAHELFAMTGDEEGAHLFAGVIADNRLYAELQFSHLEPSGWQRQGAVLLADRTTNWIVRQMSHQEADWVVAVPLDKDHFHTILLDWIEQSNVAT
ncbi:hypothetical protein [Paenibacillus campi]|uniref:hypothetical protein n=1 Tax=Paenibacillus campi TaxID=3106031 RepID=UPI002AFF42D4|nr:MULTISPECIES: hypothetical protein [unclassified Paenibacillus]